ncbi:sensor histidine kinase [Pimelobacter simplex]|uniref:histidine kinase n=1 Tax=Nocardioides simplex TaxID=2045 RepID=A0A0A1DNW6_NOCSI|nr:sensor histidine kinase [Pimelobacter simplex]AIY19014.1 putative two-component system sensor kinase [Pimelobacter simplex]MCG8148984.1 sensor histidine kinase [Pimelobacter simplex]GEB14793.1 histidine kinase [Pimelobacter simplex]SFM25226.1 Signal transduction histidine kinase [Pimelobacter simplex]
MSRPESAWSALRGNPVRFLLSSWPWRSLAYLAGTAAVGFALLGVLLALLMAGALTAVVVVGFVLIGAIPVLCVAVLGLERRRLRVVQPDAPALGAPRPPVADGRGLRAWVRQRRGEPPSGREGGYVVLLVTLLWLLDAVVVFNAVLLTGAFVLAPVVAAADQVVVFAWTVESPGEALPMALVGGPIAYALSAYVVTLLAAGQSALARLLLSPGENELEQRIGQLRRSRLDLVDAFETERKRIERHLHDGVQQRLVALSMTLGRAELDVPEGPGLDLVRQAHGEVESALADLREAVRGIHPRVLVDHGLAAAVREVADRMPILVTVRIDVSRLPPPVEGAAYFVASEALTNVARHSGAGSAQVTGWLHDDRLVVTVTDDGAGGARIGGGSGSGLAGLVTRLDALGGTLSVRSPDGGPTEVRMECPRCVS